MSAQAPSTSTQLKDVAREELLVTVLQGLAVLGRERPGGVTLGELGKFLGLRTPALSDALECGRRPAHVGTVDRDSVVERVVTDAHDYTRSRYVLTAYGRARAGVA